MEKRLAKKQKRRIERTAEKTASKQSDQVSLLAIFFYVFFFLRWDRSDRVYFSWADANNLCFRFPSVFVIVRSSRT